MAPSAFSNVARTGPGIVTPLTEAVASAKPVVRLFAAHGDTDSERYRYLLLFRFAVANIIGLALLGAAYLQGWVGAVLEADLANLCVVIAALFVAGLALCAVKVWQTSLELNLVKAPRRPASSRVARYLVEVEGRDANSRAISAAVLRLKLFSRISAVRHTASSLVILGLIGTVIGFIIALSGVQPEAAADPKTIAPMVSTLIEGMSVALYTTLVGAVFNVWLMVNYHLLATATANLVAEIVELGERHGSV